MVMSDRRPTTFCVYLHVAQSVDFFPSFPQNSTAASDCSGRLVAEPAAARKKPLCLFTLVDVGVGNICVASAASQLSFITNCIQLSASLSRKAGLTFILKPRGI